MNKLLSLALICLGIIGGARAQTCGTTITSYPYLENFDGTTAPAGWLTGAISGTSSWQLNTLSKPIMNASTNPTKCYTTNPFGLYNNNEQSYVLAPCFNMSTLTNPTIEMKIWWNSEFNADGAVLQSSINDGATWQVVGGNGDPNNWYNSATISGTPGGQPIGWTGRNTTSNGSGGWVIAKHVLTGLGGQPNVKLRIAFGANATVGDEGFAFDNFSVYETPLNDAGITSITTTASPVLPNSTQPITVTVRNHGFNPLTAATLGLSLNGTTVVNSQAFNPTPSLLMNASSAPISMGNFPFPAGVNIVKAWTRLPNGLTDDAKTNDTTKLTVVACQALSGSYTINRGAAASATNFRSISDAVLVLQSCGVSGAVTFTVAPSSGPYNEVVTLTNIATATSTNTITFEGSGNSIVSPTTVNDAVLKLDGANFFRFNNFKIENLTNITSGAASVVTLTNNASNNIFKGCTINISNTSTVNLSGINISVGSLGTASNNNKFQDNIINGGVTGINLSGNTTPVTQTDNQFTGNILKDQAQYGFNASYSANTLFENNDISRPTRLNTLSTFYGINLGNNNNKAVISRNRIHNTHDMVTVKNGTVYGIGTSSSTITPNENIIKNNAIYNINNNGGTVWGIYHTAANGTFYYNNTISIDNPAYSYSDLRGIYTTNGPTNVKFINNIVSLASSANSKAAIQLGGTAVSLTTDNNDFYIGSSGNIGNVNNSPKATLALWQGVNSTFDVHSYDLDPQFVSADYILPLNSTINDKGLTGTGNTVDITGGARSITAPDMGAYEFTPATNDAGVTAIVSPTSPVAPGAQQVQAILKNFGNANLTTATISWKVNGVAQPDFNWTGGNLAKPQTSAPITIGTYTFPAGISTIKVWAKNPNGATDALGINDTTVLTINSCASLAGAYTIDKTKPASATNFQSITDVIQRLKTCGVSAPVTISIASGTGPYNEVVELTSIPLANSTNTITIEGNGNTVINPSTISDAAVKLDGANYFRINNLKMKFLTETTNNSAGLKLTNSANNNIISGCTIDYNITATTSLNSYGIHVEVGSSNNIFQNNTINGAVYGVYSIGTSTLSVANNQFIGNTLKDQASTGFSTTYTNNVLIEGNDISRPTRSNSGSLTGIALQLATTNAIVSKNRIHNTHDRGTSAGSDYGIISAAGPGVGSENIIKNNLIYNLNNPGGAVYGLYNNGGNNTYYFNNTVALESSPTSTPIALMRGVSFSTAVSNVKFVNNIISLPGNATLKHAIYLTAVPTSLTCDYNNIYIGSTGYVGFFPTASPGFPDKATFTDWQTTNNNAFDQHSQSIDPGFASISQGILKPTVAPLDNLGQPQAAVVDDFFGAIRNAVPDMGAIEFGIAANDAGIKGIAGPKTTGCGLSANEAITVTIKNYGANAQTSIPVSFSVDGIVITSETYTGSIAPNTTAPYTFKVKADLSVSGLHVITAQTSLSGDANTSNNSDTLRITNSLISGLPVFDFETATTGISRFQKVTNAKSNITEGAAASNGTGTKGMIMDGVTNSAWNIPVGSTDPWTNNPDHFAAAYICINPAGGYASDSLWLTFDLKQLFKTAAANTNFRVTVNGIAVGGNVIGAPANTYRPPFGGTGGTTDWTKIKVDLTNYKNDPTVTIGLESSVSENFANGTANLIDNLEIKRRIKKVALNDVGVIAVSVPNASGCGLSASETVTVTVKNHGALPQNSFPVSFSVDNGTITTETFPGPLAANATATYTFTTAQANLATQGAHAILAKTALVGDTAVRNDAYTLNIANTLISSLPIVFDFETVATGKSSFRTATNTKSNITDGAGASFGGTSTKGMIMDGVDNPQWVMPTGPINPWNNNTDNFSAAYICIDPSGGAASDSLWMTFDMKQLFKANASSTNFRVTVNGTQISQTYRPATTSTWQKVKIDLNAFKNAPIVTIGLESNVKEAYANGTGTANLIDNINVVRRIKNVTGVKADMLTGQIHVFPNPSNGAFNVELPEGKTYQLVVTDLTGKVIKLQQAKGNAKLNLEGTAKGIYLLKVSDENGSAVRKLIVE